MVRPDSVKWGQSLSDLRRLSVESVHPRTRERFLALYMSASGQTNAKVWALETRRPDLAVAGDSDWRTACRVGAALPPDGLSSRSILHGLR